MTLEVRHARFEATASDEEKREFAGIGVPYGEVIEHLLGRETFDAGAIEGAGDALVLYQHGEPIGRIISARDTAAGLEVTGRISDTATGRDAWTLLKDGAIRSLSIGFEPIEWAKDTATGVLHWTKVRAREFSLVAFPAYAGAGVDPSSLRSRPETNQKETTMDALTRADLDPLTAGLEDLKREMALINQPPADKPGAQWRSMGEFVKAVAAGDTAAADFHRAYTGSTTADGVIKDTFVGDYIKLVQDRRRLANLFAGGTLPADGMSVDYVQLKADSTQVTEQANEGDDLAYGKVELEPASAQVKTYGGWSQLSVQLIERASVTTLDTMFKALGLKYAGATDNAVAAAFKALETSRADDAVTLAAGATATNWLDAIVDVALAFEEAGHIIGGLLVTPARFKQLNNLKDGTTRLMKVYGDGVNQVGELNLTQIAGNLGGVKVTASSKVTDGGFYDPAAIELLESAGAPAQLQDSNIINLSRAFSVYGYASVITPFPAGIVPIKAA